MKVKKLYEEIYRTHLLFIYDCTAKEATDYLYKKNIKADLEKCSGQTGTYTHEDKEGARQNRYYIFIEKGEEEKYTLVHEIAHLIFMSLDDCGIEIVRGTDEIFAYYFEYWYKVLFPYLELKKAPKRKKS